MALFKTKKSNKKKTKKLSFSKFSNPQKFALLAFVSLFLLVGGYAAYQYSRAATSTTGYASPFYCPSPRPTLSSGSKDGAVVHECVRYAQWTMRNYAGQNIAVDGIFGSQTKTAVQNVQRFFGNSNPDGIIGPKTWEIIDLLIRPGDIYSYKGILRAACKEFYLRSPGGQKIASAKIGSTVEAIILQKNMGTASWSHPVIGIEATEEGRNYAKTFGPMSLTYENFEANNVPTGGVIVGRKSIKLDPAFFKAGTTFKFRSYLYEDMTTYSGHSFGPYCEAKLAVTN